MYFFFGLSTNIKAGSKVNNYKKTQGVPQTNNEAILWH